MIFFFQTQLFPRKQNNQILEVNEYDRVYGFTVQEAALADISLHTCFISDVTGTCPLFLESNPYRAQ